MAKDKAATASPPMTSAPSVSTPLHRRDSKDASSTICFSPHVEAHRSRPSFQFETIPYTVDNVNTTIRFGRHYEENNAMKDANVQFVGLDSGAVSPWHCEFECVNRQWYVKDIKSNSGTFLNYVLFQVLGLRAGLTQSTTMMWCNWALTWTMAMEPSLNASRSVSKATADGRGGLKNRARPQESARLAVRMTDMSTQQT